MKSGKIFQGLSIIRAPAQRVALHSDQTKSSTRLETICTQMESIKQITATGADSCQWLSPTHTLALSHAVTDQRWMDGDLCTRHCWAPFVCFCVFTAGIRVRLWHTEANLSLLVLPPTKQLCSALLELSPGSTSHTSGDWCCLCAWGRSDMRGLHQSCQHDWIP